MKPKFLAFLVLAVASAAMALTFSITANTRQIPSSWDKAWKQVDSLKEIGQPKSALELVNELNKRAANENNQPQLVKTLMYRFALKSSFEENYEEQAILEAKQALKDAKDPVKQLLHSIIADLYQSYYQSNRWRVLNRTKLQGDVSQDIKTWDASVFYDTIHWNYQQSLQHPENLIRIKVRDFLPILDTGRSSALYRPSLLDLLAHRAITYYQNDESGISNSIAEFEYDNPDYFSEDETFTKIRFNELKSEGPKRELLECYQTLAKAHQNDEDKTAAVYSQLQRLEIVHNSSTLYYADSLYVKTLTQLNTDYKNHEVSTWIAYYLATFYQNQPEQTSDLKRVEALCKEAMARFPNSDAAQNCDDLLTNLYRQNLSLQTPEAIYPGNPLLLSVSWQNCKELYVKVLRINFEDWEARHEQNQDALVKRYLKHKPVQEVHQKLDGELDFKNHSSELAINGLPSGYYLIIASSNPKFNFTESPVSYTTFYSTRLSAITKSGTAHNREILVLDREKGSTLAGVKVTAFQRDYQSSNRKWVPKPTGSQLTNKEGKASLPIQQRYDNYNTQYQLVLQTDTFRIGGGYFDFPHPETTQQQTFFFTDRKIFRPGQTIYFKGINIERKGKKQTCVTGQKQRISLYDANGKEVDHLEVSTNKYGSFAGSFVFPGTGLTGNYRIQSPYGSIQINVEDYKRPVFETGFKPVSGLYKLEETIKVEGFAKALAGYAISDAKVKYRVVRAAHFPYPWFRYNWFGYLPQANETVLLTGTSTTDANGQFQIHFNAIPDKSLQKQFNPYFTYTIYADVTDLNGETRSSQTAVSVGYQALVLKLDLEENLNQTTTKTTKLLATNLAGKPEKTQGSIAIYKLIAPDKVVVPRPHATPDRPLISKNSFDKLFPQLPLANENEFVNWQTGECYLATKFNTEIDSLLNLNEISNWPQGVYKFVMKAKDAFGTPVEVVQYATLFNPNASKLPYPTAFYMVPIKTVCEPGDEASVLIGSAFKDCKVLMEVVNGDTTLVSKWLTLSENQTLVSFPIKEMHRGNITMRFYSVKHNHFFNFEQVINVPFTNKKLDIVLEHFRSELAPGQKERWNIKVKNYKGGVAEAELAACLYDASLDAFAPNAWQLSLFGAQSPMLGWQESNGFSTAYSNNLFEPPYTEPKAKPIGFDQLNWFGYPIYGHFMGYRGMIMDKATRFAAVENDSEVLEMAAPPASTSKVPASSQTIGGVSAQGYTDQAEPKPADKPRTDFSETAFFFPQIETDSMGTASLSFTIPQSLTKWKLLLLAHNKQLASGVLQKELVTRKDVMLVPNAPRFLRIGDTLVFPVKVVNTSKQSLSIKTSLSFSNPVDNSLVKLLAANESAEKTIELQAGESRNVEWKLVVNIVPGVVAYRVSATSDAFSDVMEAQLPVLTNQVWLTNSYPMAINSLQEKSFSFDFPKNAVKKPGTRLSLEFTSNPAWYAIQALPYLAEPTYECADAIFRMFYANTLAAKVANSNPAIAKVYESWKTAYPDALTSNLEKNQDLKSVLLDETPWVMEAKNETQQKNAISKLFNANNIRHQQEQALVKLAKLQLGNGGYRWFDGMPDSRYVTQQILTGFGRLIERQVINENDFDGLSNGIKHALEYTDERMLEEYNRWLELKAKNLQNGGSYYDIQYLYARSLFVNKYPLAPKYADAHKHYLKLALKNWQNDGLYHQAMLAIAFKRYHEEAAALLIMKSLAEKALYNEEMGMYWRQQAGWYWYQAPIETQAQLIEAFAEVTEDTKAVDEMKKWLLKQKQTQAWATTTATAEAIYALMLQGSNLLIDNKPVEIFAKGQAIWPDPTSAVEPGTGYFKKVWTNTDIPQGMDQPLVKNPNKHIAWGAVYLQYFEDYDKVKPATSPLNLEKKLFVERHTGSGPALERIDKLNNLQLGDKVVVRIILRVDRNMEFVHMKDLRASGFEPIDVLSGYHYRDGLGYYQSSRDAATHFFFNYLPKGTWVFEYALRVFQKGSYNNGFTQIECMYAPEFSARSQSELVRVK